jgi:membrane associated rhomboid family serine protease
MSWLHKLEKIASPIAIPGLIRYVAFLSSAVFVIGLALPDLIAFLPLIPSRVLTGELWRIFTFAFIPSSFSLFWIFALMFLFMMGDALEQAMGATRLTLFYLMGWLATVLCAFLFQSVGSPLYLNLSILLAFATLFPDTPILIMFILPVKVKWIALLSLLSVIAFAGSVAGFATLALCLGNYFLFFGFDLVKSFRTGLEINRRRHEFREKARPTSDSLHLCKVCGRTENNAPDLEFRVATDGEEYCTEHLPLRSLS